MKKEKKQNKLSLVSLHEFEQGTMFSYVSIGEWILEFKLWTTYFSFIHLDR